MLLEIAYLRPFAAMMRQRDRSQVAVGSAYYAAGRLSRSVYTQMGPEYAEVTKKLAHTDFGKSFSMEESKLQEAFYQDVICEREHLERRLRG